MAVGQTPVNDWQAVDPGDWQQVNDWQTQSGGGQQQPGLAARGLAAIVPAITTQPSSILSGAGKGILSTVGGLGSIFNRLTGSNQPLNQETLASKTQPTNTFEKMGKFGEQVGEFALGEGAAGKLVANPLLAKTLAGGAVGGVQSGGDPLATGLSAALPALLSAPVARAAGKFLSGVFGRTSGAGAPSLERAFSNPDANGLAKVMRGDLDINDVVDNVQRSVTNFRDAAAAKYRQGLDTTTNTQIPDWSNRAKGFLQNIDKKLGEELKNFNVIQNPDGAWNFRHMTGADPAEVKNLIDTIQGWGSEPRDLTPAGLDILKKKLGDYAGQGGSMSALGSRLYDEAKSNLESIIHGYKEMTSDYAKAADYLRQMKNEMSVSASGQGNPGTVARKLTTLLKQNNDYREMFLSKLPNGQDLLDQIAGLHLKDWNPKGLMGTFTGAGALHMMFHPGMTLTPGMAAAVASSSPRIVGQTAMVAGKVAANPATNPLLQAARRAGQVGVAGTGQNTTQ